MSGQRFTLALVVLASCAHVTSSPRDVTMSDVEAVSPRFARYTTDLAQLAFISG